MKTFLLFFLLFPFWIWGQQIRGKVIDNSSEKSLAKASVFISNTSIGTITNENGEFVLGKLPVSPFDLVISYVGYETLVMRISNLQEGLFLFKLQPKDNNLENIIVRSYEKNGWERWGVLFTNNFIGTSALADHCKILNPKDIGFVFSQKKQVLAAYSKEPIIIINKKLGYRIEFDLEQFSYDFKSKYLFYIGYPLFKELKGNKTGKNRWAKERSKVYEGSLLQFIRAVYQNNLKETGFVVRHLIRKPNKEKERAKFILDYSIDRAQIPADSMNYYKRIMKESNFTDILYTQTLDFENFAHKTDSNTVILNFKDCLYITYPRKKEDAEYYLRNNGVSPDSCITSIITLQNEAPVMVNLSGSYSDTRNLTLMTYWAWSEKLGTMLPLDYWP